jgi:hypothetical protein
VDHESVVGLSTPFPSLLHFSNYTHTLSSVSRRPPLQSRYTPTIAPQGPSQLLTALLARLPDCTNRTLIDQAIVNFAFLNSKAAQKRLVKVSTALGCLIVDMLMPNLSVPHTGSENEDGLATALFSACGYPE